MNLQPLADFRYELRQFLHFSEEAAAKVDLHTQQYQLMLQVAAATEAPTISFLAGRLLLRHNTVVELAKRCEASGLLRRTPGLPKAGSSQRDPSKIDKRVVLLSLTAKGSRTLDKLAALHARELHILAPRLIQVLQQIQKSK